jgi:hypothetical protein
MCDRPPGLSPANVRDAGAANRVSRSMNDDVGRHGCSPGRAWRKPGDWRCGVRGNRWRDSGFGSDMGLENLFSGAQGEGTSGSPPIQETFLLLRRRIVAHAIFASSVHNHVDALRSAREFGRWETALLTRLLSPHETLSQTQRGENSLLLTTVTRVVVLAILPSLALWPQGQSVFRRSRLSRRPLCSNRSTRRGCTWPWARRVQALRQRSSPGHSKLVAGQRRVADASGDRRCERESESLDSGASGECRSVSRSHPASARPCICR